MTTDRTPPADLVDKVAHLLWCFDEGYVLPSDRGENWMLRDDATIHPDDLRDRESMRVAAREFLAALTEWATGPDGTVALIDPATWTPVRARVADGAFECITHDGGLGVEGYDCDRKHNRTPCNFVPLYTLTQREEP